MVATINVLNIDITPNDCPLSEALSLSVEFSTDEDVPNAHWEISYLVDYTNKRHVIEMGKTETTTYAAGTSRFTFSVPEIDIAGIKPSILTNVGLLLAVLKSGEEEVIQVSMVTQVAKKDGQLYRTIFSPLD